MLSWEKTGKGAGTVGKGRVECILICLILSVFSSYDMPFKLRVLLLLSLSFLFSQNGSRYLCIASL